MTMIAMPTGYASIDWTPPPRAAWVSKSGYSGKTTVIDRGTVTEGYRASVTVAPQLITGARLWRAWHALMKGPVNTTELSPTDGSQAGTAVNSVAFNAATAAGVSSFVVYGSPGIGATVLLKAGSFVQIGARLHVLTADLSFGTEIPNPLAGMFIDPPLAAAMPINGNVLVRSPVCTMRVVAPLALGWNSDEANIIRPVTFQLEEVL